MQRALFPMGCGELMVWALVLNAYNAAVSAV